VPGVEVLGDLIRPKSELVPLCHRAVFVERVSAFFSVLQYSGVLGRQTTDSRPVKFITAMGEQGKEAVAQETGDR
jgi:hypothetical protein